MQEELNDRANTDPVKLTDITRGLYHAASSTYSMVANQYINLLSQYFDEAADGTYVPKTVEVQLPDESKMSIPLVSLVAPKGLMLDKVNFDFAVVAEPSGLAQATTDLNKLNDLTRSSFKVEMAAQSHDGEGDAARSRTGQVDISMQFRAIDPPEGLMRVFDKFAALVTPLKPAASYAMRSFISPRFTHIISVLQNNERAAKDLEFFNDDFSIEALQQRNNHINEWEKDLLEKSSVLMQEGKVVRDQFKQTYEYARIVFEGSVAYEKLLLSLNISRQLREWTGMAEKFYNTLLTDELLAEKLQKLEKADGVISSAGKRLEQEYNLVKEVAEKLKTYDTTKNKLEKETEWLRKFTALTRMLLKDQPQLLAHLFPELPDF